MKCCNVPILLVALLVTGALFLASCASAPPAAPPPAAEPTAPAAPQEPAKVVPPPDAERSQALELRAAIEKYGLAGYAQADWQAGEKQLEQGQSLYDKDNDGARTALQEAARLYRAVLDAGFPQLVAQRQGTARGAKDGADRLKAAVALADAYAPAADLYQQAMAAQKAKDYARAVDLFSEVAPLFEALAAQAAEKREKAQQALREVQDGLQRAEAQGAEAEQVRYAVPGEEQQ